MTNSEIKCEHDNCTEIPTSYNYSKWCQNCGAFYSRGEWHYPTRTPEPTKCTKKGCECGGDAIISEPTKAENGLVRLDEMKLERIIFDGTRLFGGDGRITNVHRKNIREKIMKSFGTPSITKEQLLAILPDMVRQEDIDSGLMSLRYAEGWDDARNYMKQRIEELGK